MKILSVDDNAANLYLIEAMARAHGYQIVSAINGRKALDLLEHEMVDVIVSDILMPEMDGFQLCREVKHDPRFRNIPFIFYTATYTTKRDEDFGLSLGAAHFLIKPLDPEQFMKVIADTLAQGPSKPEHPFDVEEDAEYLRIHNERLVDKLGKKIHELEITHDDLHHQLAEKELEIARRAKAEEELAHTARQLTRANQDLTQFAYAAAHDLREPLRNVSHVLGLLQLDHAALLDKEASQLIELGLGGLKRMHDMVTDLLSFTKIVDSRPVNCPAIDSNVVVRSVLQNFAPTIAQTDATVTVEDLPPVMIEETHFAQLLQNLIANALKYSQPGTPPDVKISASMDGSMARFLIEDHGIGFDSRYSEHIFGIFKRLHPSHEYEGTGIGLAICSRIVALYGGNIWAESEPRKGARFFFTLPLVEQAQHRSHSA